MYRRHYVWQRLEGKTMKHMTKSRSIWIVLTVAFVQMAVLFTPCSSHGRNVYWVQGGDGQWSGQTWFLGIMTWSNWQDPSSSWPYYTVPNAGDIAWATASGSQPSQTITYDVTGSPAQLRSFILDHTGTNGQYMYLTMTGSDSLVMNSESVIVGREGRGWFTQGSGQVNADLLLIANMAGAGTYTLGGTGRLTTRETSVGSCGAGMFDQAGGTHTTSGLNIGWDSLSTGSYTLSAGTLTVNGTETLGALGTGNFLQMGGTHTVQELNVGSYDGSYWNGGTGSFLLTGGSFTAVNENIGWDNSNGGTGSFFQSGGTHTVTGTLDIKSDKGTYTLAGGTLTAGNIVNSGTFTQVRGTVSGPFRNNNIYTYNGGTFNGRLANYGTVNFNADFTAGNGMGNYAALTIPAGRTVTLNGAGLDNQGTLEVKGTLTGPGAFTNSGNITNTGAITGAGTYTQSGGTTINNGILTRTTIDIQGGTFGGSGTINGAVIVGSGAIFSPGNSPGTITINGDLASSGTWVFEIAGLNAGQYDVLNVTGNATFTGGTFRFDFLGGLTPSAGDTWTFFLANSITGWNSLTFEVNGLAAGQTWSLIDVAGGKAFQVTSSVPLPAGLWLLGPALAGLFALRKKVTAGRRA
jgi:hypothetical protein